MSYLLNPGPTARPSTLRYDYQRRGRTAVVRAVRGQGESGAIFLELVLTLPVLVVLLVVAFEFGNLLQLKQGITFVARESAAYAFRECSPYSDDDAMDACVAYVQARMQNLGALSLGNINDFDVMISIFDRNGALDPDRIANAPGPTFPNTGGLSRLQRHLNANGSVGEQNIRQMAINFERIVAAEVQVRYQPILLRNLRLNNVVFNLPNNLFFYEVAVY